MKKGLRSMCAYYLRHWKNRGRRGETRPSGSRQMLKRAARRNIRQEGKRCIREWMHAGE